VNLPPTLSLFLAYSDNFLFGVLPVLTFDTSFDPDFFPALFFLELRLSKYLAKSRFPTIFDKNVAVFFQVRGLTEPKPKPETGPETELEPKHKPDTGPDTELETELETELRLGIGGNSELKL
jgi:hypothetical protein